MIGAFGGGRLTAWMMALAIAALGPAPETQVAVQVPAEGQGPVLPPVLNRDPTVKDPVFALLTGLLSSESYGVLTRDRMLRELGAEIARSRLPYQRLRELTRLPGPPGRAGAVSIRFDAPIVVPIPYRILGYRPGRMTATELCAFEEWSLGRVAVPSAESLSPVAIVLDDVHLFRLERGRLSADIDWWLDVLLGSTLDDTEISVLLIFRYNKRWIGMALGRNPQGQARSGSFDLVTDRLVFPSPADLRAVARDMRRRAASLAVGRFPGSATDHPVLASRNEKKLEEISRGSRE